LDSVTKSPHRSYAVEKGDWVRATIIQQVPLDKIITGKPVRERFDEESLKGLAQSMRESGQHEPIHVLPLDGDRYSLLTGGRRLKAARKNGSLTIAAIVEADELSKGDTLVRQITENAQREDLKIWEKAKAIDLLMKETGWNASQTAAKLGFTNGTITKLLSVLSLPEPIQKRIRDGEIPATAAYELTHVNDVAAQDQFATRIANGELTRDGLSGAIKSRKRNRRTKTNASRRRSCAKARLPGRQSVTVSATNLDLSSFVVIVETLLTHAKAAQSEGLTLDALLQRLKELSRDASQSSGAPLPALPDQTESDLGQSDIRQAV
jgi:ParB family chromosome partitioning protein